MSPSTTLPMRSSPEMTKPSPSTLASGKASKGASSLFMASRSSSGISSAFPSCLPESLQMIPFSSTRLLMRWASTPSFTRPTSLPSSEMTLPPLLIFPFFRIDRSRGASSSASLAASSPSLTASSVASWRAFAAGAAVSWPSLRASSSSFGISAPSGASTSFPASPASPTLASASAAASSPSGRSFLASSALSATPSLARSGRSVLAPSAASVASALAPPAASVASALALSALPSASAAASPSGRSFLDASLPVASLTLSSAPSVLGTSPLTSSLASDFEASSALDLAPSDLDFAAFAASAALVTLLMSPRGVSFFFSSSVSSNGSGSTFLRSELSPPLRPAWNSSMGVFSDSSPSSSSSLESEFPLDLADLTALSLVDLVLSSAESVVDFAFLSADFLVDLTVLPLEPSSSREETTNNNKADLV